MIVAAWMRWRERRHVRWLLLAGAVIALDVLIGARLLAWELELLRESLDKGGRP